MDQWMVAALAIGSLGFFVAGYYIGNAERKVRNEYEPTETGVLPPEPFIMPMPPVQPTKGRRPF